jgi:hypothetical protein
MKLQKNSRFTCFVLFSNGVADLLAAIALFFPVFNLPLPGFGNYTPELKFVAGGWGIAALTFGVGRIWASYKPGMHQVMVILGLFEGCVLTIYCLINVLLFGMSWVQVILPLVIASIFSVLYLALIITADMHSKR